MADQAPAPAAPAQEQPATQPSQQPTESQASTQPPDEATQALEQIKALLPKAKLPLKNKKHGDATVKTFDELISYAQKGFGAHGLVEEARTKSAKADEVLRLREALAGDDENAALAALEALAGDKAAKLAIRQAEKYRKQQEEEAGLSERELQMRRALEERDARLRALEAREAQQKREQHEASEKANIQRVREELETVAIEALQELKADRSIAPLLVRRMATPLRIAAESGDPITAQKAAAEALESLRQEQALVLGSLAPESLYDTLGPQRVAQLSKLHLRRSGRGGLPPAPGNGAAPKQTQLSDESELRGSPRFFR